MGWRSGAALEGVVGGVDAAVKGGTVVSARRESVVAREERVRVAGHENGVGEVERVVDGVVKG